MVLDTSALLAILQGEPEGRAFIDAIESADRCSMSVGNFLESSIVVESRFGSDGSRDLDLFLLKARVKVVACDQEQAEISMGSDSIDFLSEVSVKSGSFQAEPNFAISVP